MFWQILTHLSFSTIENEKALIMRLHLMKAVLYFHQNRKKEASQMLQQAEIELNGLRVNEGCLEALIEMGSFLVQH
jgi:hypothetical protein